jgi:hypothetical protein
MRGLGPGGALLALVGVAVAGPSIAANLEAPAWAIAPEDAACHMEFELTSRSGAKMGLPAEAFLPIRIDGRPFSNLVQRTGQEGVALMGLSDETLSAMRHGKTLQIAWLSEEAVSGSLAGAAQGISDLKTCGAQVAADHRSREAELEASRARQAAEARAKAVSDEQLKAARAQTAAADAAPAGRSPCPEDHRRGRRAHRPGRTAAGLCRGRAPTLGRGRAQAGDRPAVLRPGPGAPAAVLRLLPALLQPALSGLLRGVKQTAKVRRHP